MSWWDRAPKDARIAQIKGGIELGMTAKQTLLASGVPLGLYAEVMPHIHIVARRGGLHFPPSDRVKVAKKARQVRRGAPMARAAYFEGAPAEELFD